MYEEEYAIFTEFQGRRGSDALITAIPLSETSSSHRGPNWTSEWGERPRPCF